MVVTKERTSKDFVDMNLIEDQDNFIELTAAGAMAKLIYELSLAVCKEAKQIGLDVSHYDSWSEDDFELLRVALCSLGKVALRHEEIRRLKARIGRELILVSGERREIEDGPVEPSGFRWKGNEFSGLTPTAFRLLRFHWGEGEWLTRYFNKDAFDRDVFNDAGGTVNRNRVDSHQNSINCAFIESGMLLYMKVELDRSFVRVITEDEFAKKKKKRQARTKS